MKSLSSLDIYFLTQELQSILKAHLDKVYQGEGDQKGDFTFQLNRVGQGKIYLRFLTPSMLFLADEKPAYGKMPGHFATFLRRHLGNARIQGIRQQGFERIIEFDLENKNGTFTLIFELIQPGNLLLVNSDRKIVSLLTPKKLKDRTVRGGAIYEPPPAQFDVTTASEQDIVGTLAKTGMDAIVKAVAIDLGFGGTYAEEICHRANVEKSAKGTKQELTNLAKVAKTILKEKLSPNTTEKDVFPIAMQSQKKTADFPTFSAAIASTAPAIEAKVEKKTKKDKKDTVLQKQRSALEGYNKSAEENQRKGEIIYEHYQEISEMLSSIKKARETMSWPEIKKKLKDKRITAIDEKNGKITVEF